MKNTPAFKFAILLSAGIIIGSFITFSFTVLVILIMLLLALLAFSLNKERKAFLTSAVIIIIILTGIFKANIDFNFIPENSIRYFPDSKKGTKYELTGIISEIPFYDSSKIRFVLESNFIHTQFNSYETTGDVIVTIWENRWGKNEKKPLLKVGDKVTLLGRLSEASGARNPGEFDYRRYLRLHDIYKVFTVTGYENAVVLSEKNLSYFYQDILFPSKEFAMRNIDENMKGDEAAYLKGLVSGERSDISKETKEAFINTGVMHLIAVSGLNVAYIIIAITLILSLFRVKPMPRTVITITVLIFYCIFTGSPPSIIRATIMGSLVLVAIQMERKTNFYNIVGVSAIFILLYDSKQLFDAGFILSYSAVIAMVFLFTRFEKIFLNKIIGWNVTGKKIVYYIAVLFLTTLAAQLGTLPIVAMYFEKISIVSLLANLVVVPFANIALAIGFFQIIAGVFSNALSSAIAETNNLILTGQLWFIKQCASFDFAYVNFYKFNLFNTISYFTALLLLFTIKNRGQIAYRLLLVLLIFCGAFVYNYDFDKKLKVTFLDIGQGDCALIQTPDDKNILIDAGNITENYNSGERTISPYLKRCGINKIDLLILTHLHNDHIGGVNFLLENFRIGKIIESGQTVSTPFTYKMDSLILYKKIPRIKVECGDELTLSNQLKIYFLFPDREFVNGDGYTKEDNLNNGSVALILKYKDVDFFFGGDIERDAEVKILQTYADFIDTDILKVSHHGSLTSSTIPFLVKNTPEYSVISCGLNNRYNHPSDVVLKRLENSGSQICRTDLSGAVIFETDGKEINLINWR